MQEIFIGYRSRGAGWVAPAIVLSVLAIASTDAAAQAPAAASSAAGKVFQDCADCPEMVSIPAGSFTMGSPTSEAGRLNSEGPQRSVSVPAFAAGKYEVTWAEWESCVADGGCSALKDDGFGKGAHPVTNVSWDDAKVYAAWLSRKTGQTYRLLSEAEWEYAARAGTTTAYSFGDSISVTQANHRRVSGQPSYVGQSPLNAFGLHDMHGNVWEWVEDCSADNYGAGQPTDGRPYTSCSSGSERVSRGGSWVNGPESLRSARRSSFAPSNRIDVLGFRVARTNP